MLMLLTESTALPRTTVDRSITGNGSTSGVPVSKIKNSVHRVNHRLNFCVKFNASIEYGNNFTR